MRKSELLCYNHVDADPRYYKVSHVYPRSYDIRDTPRKEVLAYFRNSAPKRLRFVSEVNFSDSSALGHQDHMHSKSYQYCYSKLRSIHNHLKIKLEHLSTNQTGYALRFLSYFKCPITLQLSLNEDSLSKARRHLWHLCRSPPSEIRIVLKGLVTMNLRQDSFKQCSSFIQSLAMRGHKCLLWLEIHIYPNISREYLVSFNAFLESIEPYLTTGCVCVFLYHQQSQTYENKLAVLLDLFKNSRFKKELKILYSVPAVQNTSAAFEQNLNPNSRLHFHQSVNEVLRQAQNLQTFAIDCNCNSWGPQQILTGTLITPPNARILIFHQLSDIVARLIKPQGNTNYNGIESIDISLVPATSEVLNLALIENLLSKTPNLRSLFFECSGPCSTFLDALWKYTPAFKNLNTLNLGFALAEEIKMSSFGVLKELKQIQTFKLTYFSPSRNFDINNFTFYLRELRTLRGFTLVLNCCCPIDDDEGLDNLFYLIEKNQNLRSLYLHFDCKQLDLEMAVRMYGVLKSNFYFGDYVFLTLYAFDNNLHAPAIQNYIENTRATWSHHQCNVNVLLL